MLGWNSKSCLIQFDYIIPAVRQIASNPIHIKVEFTFYSCAASSFYDNFYDTRQSKSIIFCVSRKAGKFCGNSGELKKLKSGKSHPQS